MFLKSEQFYNSEKKMLVLKLCSRNKSEKKIDTHILIGK